MRLLLVLCLLVLPPLQPDPRFKTDALLIVAHPDDDTAIGAYLARLKDEGKRVAVIYCTSGDGGGNEVGNEAGRSLGEIRIQEARRALGSLGIENVWFLNRGDTPGQDVLWSLDHWRHGLALDQVVRLVRLTRPTVILTWLPDAVAGENHSDHQAAGVLATEAFDLSGDRTKFTEQVSPARDRTGMMNYTEGLQTWQPQKIYYFTDAFDNFNPYWHDPKDLSPFRKNLLDGQGPSYPSSPKYARLAAEQLTFYQTQDAKLGRSALEKNDLSAFEFPVRFIFGKSVVGGSRSADIFEATSAHAVPFAPVEGYRPTPDNTLSLSLGDPWLFYQQFWQAHGLAHLATLLPVAEIGAPFGGALHIPLVIHNGTPETQTLTLSVTLPPGWTDKSNYGTMKIGSGETVQLQSILQAPEAGKPQWEELHWKLGGAGHQAAAASLRVYSGKGSALPQ